jgi:hypothetical protein
MKWNFEVMEDIVCVRTDPEFADYDNPRGEIYGSLFYIRATNDRGERKVLSEPSFKTNDEAGRFLHTLSEYSPNTKDWAAIQPMYGSDAFIRDDGEYGLMDDEERDRHDFG